MRPALRRGSDVLVIVARSARTADAGRSGRFGLAFLVRRRDGRREHVERDTLLVAFLALRPALAPRARSIFAVAGVAARLFLARLFPAGLFAHLRLVVLVVAVGGVAGAFGLLVLILVIVLIVVARAALLLEAGAALVQDAEVMIRILKVIFGLDAIAAHLGVAGEALIFFEQLGRVAALPVVLAVARIGVGARRTTAAAAAAAAPAAALTIVDQTKILTKRVLLPHVAAGPVPASLSCATREASAACSASHHFRNRLFASDQAIGGRRRQAFTHPLLCLAPSLRPM